MVITVSKIWTLSPEPRFRHGCCRSRLGHGLFHPAMWSHPGHHPRQGLRCHPLWQSWQTIHHLCLLCNSPEWREWRGAHRPSSCLLVPRRSPMSRCPLDCPSCSLGPTLGSRCHLHLRSLQYKMWEDRGECKHNHLWELWCLRVFVGVVKRI